MNFQKFQEANDLLQLGGAFSISQHDELKTILDKLITEKLSLETASTIARKYVSDHIGGTHKILDKLAENLPLINR